MIDENDDVYFEFNDRFGPAFIWSAHNAREHFEKHGLREQFKLNTGL